MISSKCAGRNARTVQSRGVIQATLLVPNEEFITCSTTNRHGFEPWCLPSKRMKFQKGRLQVRQQSGSSPLCVSLRGDRILPVERHKEEGRKYNLPRENNEVYVNQRLLLTYRSTIQKAKG